MTEPVEPVEPVWPFGSGTPEDPYRTPPGWTLDLTEDQARELYAEHFPPTVSPA